MSKWRPNRAAAVSGSTYLVDTHWAENIIRDSLQSGVKLVIKKKETNKSPAGIGGIGTPFRVGRAYPALAERYR